MYYFLSIIASILVVLGYLPEFYDICKTKTATIENMYIWFIWSAANIFSIVYCILNQYYYIMITHIIVFSMNSTTFLLKYYYIYLYKPPIHIKISNEIENNINDVVIIV
jgi:uncharacterized protein with PQ loop repeat